MLRPTAPWRVREVTALPNDRLFVRFVDGLTGIVDLFRADRVPGSRGVRALAGPDPVRKVHVEMGAVVWPGELDLAPDAMHDAIQQHGE